MSSDCALIAIATIGGILIAIISVLPRDIQDSMGDFTSQFMPNFAYINLRLGRPGSGPGTFSDVRSAAVDSAGNIYVADRVGGRIQVFDSSGAFKHMWNIEDPKAYIDAVEVDNKGVVYVLYKYNIYRYEAATGKPLGKLPFAIKLPDTHLDMVRNMALTANGNIAMTNGRDVAIITPSGEQVQVLFKPLQNVTENSGASLTLAVDNQGNIYILDTTYSVVYKFSAKGEYITRFGGSGKQPGLFYYPYSIAVDKKDRVYVGDSSRIQVFDGKGSVLESIGVEGLAYHLGFDSQNRMYAVMSSSGNPVLRFAIKN